MTAWWKQTVFEAAGLGPLVGREERHIRGLLSYPHSVLQALAAGNDLGAVPHGDAAGWDAVNGASVKGILYIIKVGALAFLRFRRK